MFIHRGGEKMASYRYRVKIPSENIEGFDISINGGEAQIIVFSKPQIDDIELARAYKGKVHIIVDFCDDHFLHPQLGAIYQEMYQLADSVVCCSEFLAAKLDAEYIPDPYEFNEVKPHAQGENLVWFGSQTNIRDLDRYRDLPNLRIVSDAQEEGITHYTEENLERAMLEANKVLIPSRHGAEYKSPNRLINSLRRGLFPIAHPVPSHREFRQFAWVGEIEGGLRWSKAFEDELNDRVREGQDYIRDRFSPKTVGGLWQDLLESI